MAKSLLNSVLDLFRNEETIEINDTINLIRKKTRALEDGPILITPGGSNSYLELMKESYVALCEPIQRQWIVYEVMVRPKLLDEFTKARHDFDETVHKYDPSWPVEIITHRSPPAKSVKFKRRSYDYFM